MIVIVDCGLSAEDRGFCVNFDHIL